MLECIRVKAVVLWTFPLSMVVNDPIPAKREFVGNQRDPRPRVHPMPMTLFSRTNATKLNWLIGRPPGFTNRKPDLCRPGIANRAVYPHVYVSTIFDHHFMFDTPNSPGHVNIQDRSTNLECRTERERQVPRTFTAEVRLLPGFAG